jgi:hypothetical protein
MSDHRPPRFYIPITLTFTVVSMVHGAAAWADDAGVDAAVVATDGGGSDVDSGDAGTVVSTVDAAPFVDPSASRPRPPPPETSSGVDAGRDAAYDDIGCGAGPGRGLVLFGAGCC